MLRRCAAASSYSCSSHFYNPFHHSGKILRGHIIDGLSVPLLRKPRIRLYNNRKRGIFQKLFQNRNHLLRSHTTVYTKSVHPQSFQQSHNSRYICSRKQFSSFIKNRSCEHRKRRVFFGCKYGGLQFIGITHCLNMNQIRARFFSQDHDFPESLICRLKFQISHGF